MRFTDDLISIFLLPPFNLIILGGVGLFLLRSSPKLGRVLVFLSLAFLYLVSTPVIVDSALSYFESSQHSLLSKPADAIVVIGGGPDYSPQRVRYAALLHKRSGLPILVSGGGPNGDPGSETGAMVEALTQEFNVPVKWLDASSRTTYENARNSFAILSREKIRTIDLVTHAWHMPRAALVFRSVGFEVVESPVQGGMQAMTVLSFLPDAESLLKSKILMREMIGLIWYRVVFLKAF